MLLPNRMRKLLPKFRRRFSLKRQDSSVRVSCKSRDRRGHDEPFGGLRSRGALQAAHRVGAHGHDRRDPARRVVRRPAA
jgi:hypothetical protein